MRDDSRGIEGADMASGTIYVVGHSPENIAETAKKAVANKAAKLAVLAERLGVKESDTSVDGVYLSYNQRNYYDMVELFDALIDKICERG